MKYFTVLLLGSSFIIGSAMAGGDSNSENNETNLGAKISAKRKYVESADETSFPPKKKYGHANMVDERDVLNSLKPLISSIRTNYQTRPDVLINGVLFTVVKQRPFTHEALSSDTVSIVRAPSSVKLRNAGYSDELTFNVGLAGDTTSYLVTLALRK